MTRGAFERLVRQVMRSLPAHLFDELDNVAIVVEDEPDTSQDWGRDPNLLAIYLGVPRTDRGGGYHLAEPDRIVLFQDRLEAIAPHPADLRRELKRTLLHEIAHHYGISDDDLHAWRRY